MTVPGTGGLVRLSCRLQPALQQLVDGVDPKDLKTHIVCDNLECGVPLEFPVTGMSMLAIVIEGMTVGFYGRPDGPIYPRHRQYEIKVILCGKCRGSILDYDDIFCDGDRLLALDRDTQERLA